jgi:hypothetical protein
MKLQLAPLLMKMPEQEKRLCDTPTKMPKIQNKNDRRTVANRESNGRNQDSLNPTPISVCEIHTFDWMVSAPRPEEAVTDFQNLPGTH